MSSDAQGIPHVEINGDELEYGSTLEHVQHGPLEVESFSFDAMGTNRVIFTVVLSENPRVLLQYTEEELQERWGSVISDDPVALHNDQGEADG